MSVFRRLSHVAGVAVVVLAALGGFTTATTLAVSAAPTWAPAATAPIHPGVQTRTTSGQCTANFVFTDASNNVYIGQAAHCTGTGAANDTNGCTAKSLPLGATVNLGPDSTAPIAVGTMVYNSWLTMQS
ncbi:MAG: hypothetical protein QOC92_4251, partial [Acidimicrobiaceae bacterium]